MDPTRSTTGLLHTSCIKMNGTNGILPYTTGLLSLAKVSCELKLWDVGMRNIPADGVQKAQIGLSFETKANLCFQFFQV